MTSEDMTQTLRANSQSIVEYARDCASSEATRVIVTGLLDERPVVQGVDEVDELTSWCTEVYATATYVAEWLGLDVSIDVILQEVSPWEPEASWRVVPDRDDSYILPDGTHIRWIDADLTWEVID